MSASDSDQELFSPLLSFAQLFKIELREKEKDRLGERKEIETDIDTKRKPPGKLSRMRKPQAYPPHPQPLCSHAFESPPGLFFTPRCFHASWQERGKGARRAAFTPSSGPRGKYPFLNDREKNISFILFLYLMYLFLVQSSQSTNMKKPLLRGPEQPGQDHLPL